MIPDLIQRQLGNQFVGGGLVLMLTGSALALARSVPARIWAWCKRRVTRAVTIDNRDPLFDYITYWLNSQERFSRSRALAATTQLRLQRLDEDGDLENCSIGSGGGRRKKKQPLHVFYSSSVGRHFFRYQSVWVSISQLEDRGVAPASGQTQNGGGGQYQANKRTYSLESFGKDNGQVLKALIQEIVVFGTQDTEGVRLYTSSWGHWESSGYCRMRPLNTVVLPAGVAETVLADMREFRSEEKWYRDLGIPWHKGYMFHGLPGTGKTSLAAALAGELEMDIYLLNLSGSGMNDEALQRLMGNVRPGCMVILEDIDCTVPDRDAPSNPARITLSGLLNCLDGITSREGCVIVMTTNHREALDAALLRPGRVDFELEFDYATDEQVMRLAHRIGVSVDGLLGQRMTMAEAQKELVGRYRSRQAVAA